MPCHGTQDITSRAPHAGDGLKQQCPRACCDRRPWSGGFNGIWEMEKPRAHGVEVREQKAVQLALTAFLPRSGSQGDVVP